MITYNATIVNSYGKTVTLEQIDFEGTPVGYLCEVDLGSADVQAYRTSRAAVRGEIVLPGHRQSRTVRVDGIALGIDRNGLRELHSELTAVIGGGMTSLTLTTVIAGETRAAEGVAEGNLEWEELSPSAARFSFLIVCGDPVMYSETVATVQVGSSTDIILNGDATVGFVAAIEGDPAAAVTDISLKNVTTGRTLRFDNLTFGTGDSIIVDTTPGKESALLNGEYFWGSLVSGSAFPLLVPGTNVLSLIVNDGTGVPTCEIEFKRGWFS